MKIFPTADVNFYIEKPSCSLLDGASDFRIQAVKPFTSKNMYHWRDIDGHKKTEIKVKDLYFEKYPKTRIRPQACLGMLYSTGFRFVKLSMAPPANFKCAPLPVNLQTARVVNSKCIIYKNLKFISIEICNYRVAKNK